MSPFQRYRTIFRICCPRHGVTARQYADVLRVTAGHAAEAKSALDMIGLGATSGQRPTVKASGPGAREAAAALPAILGELVES